MLPFCTDPTTGGDLQFHGPLTGHAGNTASPAKSFRMSTVTDPFRWHLAPGEERLQHEVEAFLADFAAGFTRKDQLQWAAVYLLGLFSAAPRKNVQAMLPHVPLSRELAARDPVQSLQHFLNQSPWDERRLWQRLRAAAAGAPDAEDGVVILDEITFPKQGRHSVGVQRQFSSAHGQKRNCQIAVAAYHVGPTAIHPLALCLYLPARWVQDSQVLDAAKVPAEYRRPSRRPDLVHLLIDEILAEHIPFRGIVAGTGLRALPAFVDRHRTLDDEQVANRQQQLATALARMQGELGLGHFEGRSWRGFHHHVCLVHLAYRFLMSSARKADLPALPVG